MSEQPPGDGNVATWRLGDLERRLEELTRVVQGSTTTLGGQITGLSNQIGNLMVSLPEHYSPRLEAAERHKAINDRFVEFDNRLEERKKNMDERLTLMERNADQRMASNTRRIERIERAGWAVAIGMVMMLLGVVFAVAKSTAGAG